MQGKPSERLYKNADIQRMRVRNDRFEKIRRAREELASEKRHLQEELEELDYLQFYPEPQRSAIIASLTAPPPFPLPPLDVTTISYYRRLSKPVFQTRMPDCADLDPHLTHESLHILSMLPESCYPNFAALTRQFQRDLRLYLSAKSQDIHLMAVIAAGNRNIGREKDILAMVEEDEGNIWVLFNHIFSQKSQKGLYKALLPYIIRINPIAFRAFYQFSNVSGHESISWFFENDDVVEALLRALQSSDTNLRSLTIRIIGNVLGEDNESYVTVLLNTPFLDLIFRFLVSSQPIDRKDACWMLANVCSYETGAVAVLRKSLIAEKLIDLLYYEQNLEIRQEIGHIFCQLIQKGDKPLAFQYTARRDFLQVLVIYLAQGDDQLTIISAAILEGLITLGEEYKDENDQNIVKLMILGMPDLMNEIRQAQDRSLCQISEAAVTILGMLGLNETMEGEI